MQMHVHAFHTHNAHMIYTCMYVWIVYSPCLLDVIDLIGYTHTHTCIHMHTDACMHTYALWPYQSFAQSKL